MDVDAAADFEMDIAMDFDMENEFLLDNEIRRTASPMTGSTRKPEKNRKQVRSLFLWGFALLINLSFRFPTKV